MNEVIQQVNPIMWVFALILIGFVLVQVIVFMQRALAFNKKYSVLTRDEVKMALTTGVVSTFGPSFSVVVIALVTIGLFGSGAAYMRMGVIGSDSYELWLADVAANSLQVELGTQQVTLPIFTVALFAMILGSSPYFLNCFLTLKPMEKGLNKARTVKGSFASIVGPVAMMALLGYFMASNVANGWLHRIGMLASASVTFVLFTIARKKGWKWLHAWILATSMIVALVVVMIAKNRFGLS